MGEIFYPPSNFFALPAERSQYDSSRAVALPIPYDSTTSARAGARDGPTAIILASQDLETFDLELGYDVSLHGIHTLPEIAPHTGSPAAMVDRIEGVVSNLLNDGKFVLTLGGEHTVTVGTLRAHAKRIDNLSVLSIDAHADVRDEYLDSPYNHACVMRRVVECCPAVVQVGMRSSSPEQMEFIRDKNLTFLTPHAYRDLRDPPEDVAGMLTDSVYVSIDLDGLDPSEMAAVGTPEPGGMHWDEVTDLLRAVARRRKIVGCDVVELAPELGPRACAHLAARLAYRMLGLALGPVS